MKKDLLKKAYFDDADDTDIETFTLSFLPGGLFWLYIALNPQRKWKLVHGKLDKGNKALFERQYNKAFLFTRTYGILTRLSLSHKIALSNLFLPRSADTLPEAYVRADKADDFRWKEALDLMS